LLGRIIRGGIALFIVDCRIYFKLFEFKGEINKYGEIEETCKVLEVDKKENQQMVRSFKYNVVS
jgi:hypothetical protein